jgi:flagellar hook-length control protein FliK
MDLGYSSLATNRSNATDRFRRDLLPSTASSIVQPTQGGLLESFEQWLTPPSVQQSGSIKADQPSSSSGDSDSVSERNSTDRSSSSTAEPERTNQQSSSAGDTDQPDDSAQTVNDDLAQATGVEAQTVERPEDAEQAGKTADGKAAEASSEEDASDQTAETAAEHANDQAILALQAAASQQRSDKAIDSAVDGFEDVASTANPTAETATEAGDAEQMVTIPSRGNLAEQQRNEGSQEDGVGAENRLSEVEGETASDDGEKGSRDGRPRSGGARYSDPKNGNRQTQDHAGESDSPSEGHHRVSADAAEKQRALVDQLRELASAEGFDAGRPANLELPTGTEAVVDAVRPTPPVAAVATAAAETLTSSGDAQETSSDRMPATDGPRRSTDAKNNAVGESKSTSGGSNELRVRLVQRVARAFQRLGPDGGRINMMLHPAELGSLKLDLKIDGQHVNARMTAESEAAAGVLREHLPELRQKLIDSGLIVDKIELDVAQRETGTGGSFDFDRQGGAADWQRENRRHGESVQPRRQPLRAAEVRPATTASIGRTAGSLDLRA